MEDLSWKTKVKVLADASTRRNQPQLPEESDSKDEGSMKLKLFRLMYETVRDSDLKVKRAELMRGHYTNNHAFDIGFIMGDITEKFTVMKDVAATIKQLYAEWLPIEHINAYEHIANKAIEISNLIDMIRIIDKKNIVRKTRD
ncbi:uncharacterized protein LOC126978126 [Leptidea sinapis]|uniref:uncharacterized protein LOC126978126 n=1 Tax=Leptidea sinapis TaxID=189913 RepID=UPI0021C31277|nr:uncharacterized protein LOC126978126 [Leptidea sinapis]